MEAAFLQSIAIEISAVIYENDGINVSNYVYLNNDENQRSKIIITIEGHPKMNVEKYTTELVERCSDILTFDIELIVVNLNNIDKKN